MNTETVIITSLSHDGRGIAHHAGKIIFVEAALVGDELLIEYTKRKSRFDEAKITQIIKPAPDRKNPDCPHFTICGGCSLQHMDSGAQLSHKQAALLEQLWHIGQLKPKELLPPVTAQNYHYRRKARLGVRYVIKKEKLLIGFREKNGRYLADIESCSVLDASVGMKIPLLREFLLKLDSYLQIPQLEIAVGDSHTAIIIRHLTPLPVCDLALIEEFAQDHNYHIYLQPGGPETAHKFFPANKEERLSYHLKEYDLEMLFHPTDFVQVNTSINQKLVQLAIELLSPRKDDIILDLFCGIGNFTLPISKFCQKVVGVEGSSLMVDRGYENARHNHIHNVEFQCKDLSENSYTENWMADYDRILLDPPRTGAWEVIQNFSKIKATHLVYISCNPATFARDAGFLSKNGFELSTLGTLDMFPHTSHVESIALFTRE